MSSFLPFYFFLPHSFITHHILPPSLSHTSLIHLSFLPFCFLFSVLSFSSQSPYLVFSFTRTYIWDLYYATLFLPSSLCRHHTVSFSPSSLIPFSSVSPLPVFFIMYCPDMHFFLPFYSRLISHTFVVNHSSLLLLLAWLVFNYLCLLLNMAFVLCSIPLSLPYIILSFHISSSTLVLFPVHRLPWLVFIPFLFSVYAFVLNHAADPPCLLTSLIAFLFSDLQCGSYLVCICTSYHSSLHNLVSFIYSR